MICHEHADCAGLHWTASATICCGGIELTLTVMPTLLASDENWLIISAIDGLPVKEMRLKARRSFLPMPAPHCPGPVPGRAHEAAPLPGIVQPCEASRLLAWLTLNG